MERARRGGESAATRCEAERLCRPGLPATASAMLDGCSMHPLAMAGHMLISIGRRLVWWLVHRRMSPPTGPSDRLSTPRPAACGGGCSRDCRAGARPPPGGGRARAPVPARVRSGRRWRGRPPPRAAARTTARRTPPLTMRLTAAAPKPRPEVDRRRKRRDLNESPERQAGRRSKRSRHQCGIGRIMTMMVADAA